MAKVFKNLFLYIIIALLIIILIRTILGITEPFNLDSFLQILSSSPTIEFNTSITSITGDWGIFEFFKNLLNNTIDIINFLINAVNMLVNFLIFVGYFLYNFFEIEWLIGFTGVFA